MSDIDWLSHLQLRAEYGVMENQLNVAAANAFTLYGWNLNSSFYAIAGGNTIHQGFSKTRIGKPAARWEEAHSMNIGFNAMFFEGGLEIDMDYYHNDVWDLLYDQELPAQAGLAYRTCVTVGKIQ